MGSNLLAYIPTLNPRHLKWFSHHPNATLCLIPQILAESIYPRLARNMAAMRTSDVVKMIQSLEVVDRILIYDPEDVDLDLTLPHWNEWVASKEDVVEEVVRRHFLPRGARVQFEETWARWDMTAVLAEQPVIPDLVISSSEFGLALLDWAEHESQRSSDWWRRVGAIAESPKEGLLAISYNIHMPNEYETYIFGDPAINRDAGQKGKSCTLHAERAVISFCAKHGKALNGADLYVTTFPCEDCAREVAAAGIKRLFFRDGYSSLNALEVLRVDKVEIVQIREDPESA